MKPAEMKNKNNAGFEHFRSRFVSELALAIAIASIGGQRGIAADPIPIIAERSDAEIRISTDANINSMGNGTINSAIGIAPDDSYKSILGLDSGNEVFRMYWKRQLKLDGQSDNAALGAKLPFDIGNVKNELLLHGAIGNTAGAGFANQSSFGKLSLGEVLEINSRSDSRFGASLDYRINEMLKLGFGFDNARLSGADTQQYLVNMIYQPGAKDLFGIAYVQRIRDSAPLHILRLSALKKSDNFGLSFMQELKLDEATSGYGFNGTLYIAKNPAFGRKAVTAFLETRPQFGGFMDCDLATFDRSISVIESLHLQDRSFNGGAIMASYQVAIKPGYQSLDLKLGYGHSFSQEILGGRIGLSGELGYHSDSSDATAVTMMPKLSWRRLSGKGVMELYFGANVPLMQHNSHDSIKPSFVFGAGKTF